MDRSGTSFLLVGFVPVRESLFDSDFVRLSRAFVWRECEDVGGGGYNPVPAVGREQRVLESYVADTCLVCCVRALRVARTGL